MATDPGELVSLAELAQLVVGNRLRTDILAARCHARRVCVVLKYSRAHAEPDLRLFIAIEDVPRLLRGTRWQDTWRLDLERQRRRDTAELKRQVRRRALDDGVQAYVSRLRREVERALIGGDRELLPKDPRPGNASGAMRHSGPLLGVPGPGCSRSKAAPTATICLLRAVTALPWRGVG